MSTKRIKLLTDLDDVGFLELNWFILDGFQEAAPNMEFSLKLTDNTLTLEAGSKGPFIVFEKNPFLKSWTAWVYPVVIDSRFPMEVVLSQILEKIKTKSTRFKIKGT